MINSSLPVCPGQRIALRVGDGDNWHVAEDLVQGRELGNVESSMQGCDVDDLLAAAQREVQVVDVEMNDVEVTPFTEYILQH